MDYDSKINNTKNVNRITFLIYYWIINDNACEALFVGHFRVSFLFFIFQDVKVMIRSAIPLLHSGHSVHATAQRLHTAKIIQQIRQDYNNKCSSFCGLGASS